ncbi:carcinoembryonic antigen-related cell adhesion molecule 5-like [Sardina pilchardus]|uniref:carcinoembryonic antigen-related cell adhesion molecule 5-like n=1 Tax=Sardina pilchardus TaxID=27697 RepID=UPI002E1416A2
MEWIITLHGILLWISLRGPDHFHVSGQGCSGKEPVIDPPALVVKYGGPATATCRVQYSALMMGWEATVGADIKDDVRQLVWSVDNVTDWSLNGGISCFANSEDGQCSTSLPITIYKMPEHVALYISDAGPLVEGQQYSLQCEVQSVAPVNKLTVIWFRGDDELQRSGRPEFTVEGDQSQNVTVKATMEITASREDHKASYSCAAQLDMHTAEPIPDTRSNRIPLEVFYKPRVLNSTGNMSISVGDKLELSCMADANPSPSFQWKHNGVELLGNNNVHLIDSFTEDNKGVYECIIRNDQGESSAKMDVKVEMKGNQIGVIIGAVVLVAVLVVIIISAVYITLKKRGSGVI